MTRRPVLPFACLLFAGLPAAAEERAKPAQSIAKAIERGAAWLDRAAAAERAAPPPSRPIGRQALAMWALSRSGRTPAKLKPSQAWLEQRVTWLKDARAWRVQSGTYTTSLAVLAFAAPSLKRSDRPDGTVVFQRKGPAPRKSKAWIKACVRWLLATRSRPDSWGYGPMPPKENYPPQIPHWDLSNTQFAVYALYEADLAGAKVPVPVWRKVLKYLHRQQQRSGPPARVDDCRGLATSPFTEGETDRLRTRVRKRAPIALARLRSAAKARARGWSYGGNVPRKRWRKPTLAMTAAGLSSMALVTARLEARKKLNADRERSLNALRDGIAWLARAWKDVADLPKQPYREGHDPFYTLWSIGKALDACGLEVIAGKPAWRTLADLILKLQHADGSWGDPDPNGPGTLIDTAFALLTLNRATLYAYTPDGARPRTGNLRAAKPLPAGSKLGPTRVRKGR